MLVSVQGGCIAKWLGWMFPAAVALSELHSTIQLIARAQCASSICASHSVNLNAFALLRRVKP